MLYPELAGVHIDGRFAGLIIPEDLPAGFAAIYGFAPPITKGHDHRFGFGFRYGNHADFQVLYEIGPQTHTRSKMLRNSQVRTSSVRRLVLPRFPILELLKRAANYKKSFLSTTEDYRNDEPR
uniref:Uncharacterized protein n=1 Tax=Heliothis virescens TaxID=7102 RepID=A0A2A4K1U0_HELVI